MFKAIGNFLYKTPWWVLITAGSVTLLALLLFAAPTQVLRLQDKGATVQERRAIEREINLAFGDSALDFAQGVVRAMRERASDPDRQRELDHALEEIARAKRELSAAQSDTSRAVRQSAKESADAALESAAGAAEAALDAAVEAREAVQEARNDAVELLRNRGLDSNATAHSFDGMLKTATDNEKAAREALESIRAAAREAAPAASAARPQRSVTARVDLGGVHIETGGADAALPEGLRGEIRSKVGSDVWRVGVGSVLVLAFIPVWVMLMMSKYFIGRSRRALAVAEEKTAEARLSHLSRQVTEARLQALQAQVEPHFLYNTLANVQALTEVDPAAANTMVTHLIQYLRASLPKMREHSSTV
ncbi:MAG: histidine kinase, partial [Rhodoferax sp.]